MRIYYYIFFTFLISCQEASKLEKQNSNAEKRLRIQEHSLVESIFPPSAVSEGEKRVIANIYEGLMRINPLTLFPEPCLADSYYVSGDKREYTFQIKKNIYFHFDSCFNESNKRELTVSDIKNCLTFLCSDDVLNKYTEIFSVIIEGGKEYNSRETEEVSGIQILDNTTIRIKLLHPSPEFIYFLADPSSFIYPKELLEKYSKTNEIAKRASGTGPFKLQNWKEHSLLLTKNEQYYKLDKKDKKLPYLDMIEFKLWRDKKQGYSEYKKNGVDVLLDTPYDHVYEIQEKEQSLVSKSQIFFVPGFSPYIILLKEEKEDYNFSRAIAYAIDKEYINHNVYWDGLTATAGVVPAFFDNYGYDTASSFNSNTDSARYFFKRSVLLSSRKNIAINVTYGEGAFSPENSIRVEYEIQRQLNRLKIISDIRIFSRKEFSRILNSGNEGIYLFQLKGFFPSPQCYLQFFYSKNAYRYPSAYSINKKLYYNKSFEYYYEKALQALDRKSELYFFNLAERELMKDGRIIPITYEMEWLTLKPYVKNFPVSPYNYYYLTEVYLEKE